MLVYKKGDLLKSNCNIIMHQANCLSVMGAGIARAVAIQFPEAEVVDRDDPRLPKDKLGSYTVSSGRKVVVNLYGQLNVGRGLQTDYKALESAIDNFMGKYINHIKSHNLKIGVPYLMGCGLAGGDWNIVENILSRMSDKYKHDIYVYKLEVNK